LGTDYILVTILIILPEKVDREEKAPQYRVVETPVHLRPADAEDHLLVIGVQRDIICGVNLESVGVCRTCS
jgi:hypothetical protein